MSVDLLGRILCDNCCDVYLTPIPCQKCGLNLCMDCHDKFCMVKDDPIPLKERIGVWIIQLITGGKYGMD